MSKHKTSSLRGLRPSSSAQLGLGLLVVAALALLTAVIFVAVKYNALFGSWNVFQEVQPSAGSILAPILQLLS